MSIFDNESQFYNFLRKARLEKKDGADAVGLFGSRSRGDHVPGKSDIDIMVEKKVSKWGEYTMHDKDNIHVVRAPNNIDGNHPNDHALRRMREQTRWVWRRK
ncbi:MAG: nucleotidyltransferase domain-containing protein [Candidatus Pacebacteria bacterium]|nr:nucleotidyltransferase domain-containing protein [Candidatus Paceibacterota bacterium]